MSVNHLTDDEIQAYLDSEGTQRDAKLRTHLERCKACQHQVQHYRSLYGLLAEERGFELSPGFAASVIGTVKARSAKAKETKFVSLLLGVVALAIGLGTTFYYVNFTPLIKGLASSDGLPEKLDSNLLEGISELFANLSINMGLLGFGVLVLILMSAIDHFVIQSRRKPLA